MFSLCVWILLIVSIANAEQCKYEFIVPEGNCRQNPAPKLNDEEISVMHIQTSLEMANARLNSMAESFTRKLTSLDTDSKHTQQVTREVQSKLVAVQENLAELKGLKNEVKSLKDSLTDATDSLSPQLANLKDKIIDISAKFQSQTSAQTSAYSAIQRQVAESMTMMRKQAQEIENLKQTAETVKELVKRVDGMPQQPVGSADTRIMDRINSIEEKITKTGADSDVINRLKGAVNMLQSELLSCADQYRGKIRNLEGTLNLMRSEMETLKKSIQV